ncbi:hypothetical protein [Pedobacter sp.]
MKILLFIIPIALFMSCDPADNRLNIVNVANYPIYYRYSTQDSLRIEDKIYFEINPLSKLAVDSSVFYRVEAVSLGNVALTSFRWEGLANESKDGKIYFFFFSRDTLAKYNWDEIVKGKKYTGKVAYTIEDLTKINWTINYPLK